MNKFKIGQRWCWKNIQHFVCEINTDEPAAIVVKSFTNAWKVKDIVKSNILTIGSYWKLLPNQDLANRSHECEEIITKNI